MKAASSTVNMVCQIPSQFTGVPADGIAQTVIVPLTRAMQPITRSGSGRPCWT